MTSKVEQIAVKRGQPQTDTGARDDELTFAVDGKPTEENAAEQDEESDKFDVAHKESIAVWVLRVAVFALFLGAAAAVCATVYKELKQTEEKDFEEDYKALAVTMVDGFHKIQEQRTAILGDYVMSITSYLNNAPNLEWPFVELPDWGYIAGNTVQMGDFMSLATHPLVSEDQRSQWEAFAPAHTQWYKDAISILLNIPVEEVEDELYYPSTILKRYGNGFVREDDNLGTYFPHYQQYPPVPNATYSFNPFGNPHYQKTFEWVLANKRPALTPAYDFKAFSGENDPRRPMITQFVENYDRRGIKYENDPICPIVYPMFRQLGNNSENIGMVFGGIYWRTYFRNILPTNSEPILVILENTCDQMFTYQVDGPEAKFVAHGDRHDSKYDHLVVSDLQYESELLGSIEDASEGNCFFDIRVYPTATFEDEYMTTKPVVFAVSMAAVFVFTAAFFILYDYFVFRRHKAVEHSALRSHRIVSSLFPEEIRDRLYHEDDLKKAALKKSGKWMNAPEEPRANAIATLYPNCTVLFADIVGFTQWSSSRSPIEVFDLLETIYGAFDALTVKYKVTKIETIGDCYVAVAGLPEPLDRHAVAMAKFADACYRALITVVHEDLVGRLGPDTKDLTMRMGLHSGPVTAGVLRGQKSRFQMFGDTVNTASRMESTGLPDCIQASPETARLLELAGKSNWLSAREELVMAKGKGEMQTYWVNIAVDSERTSKGSEV